MSLEAETGWGVNFDKIPVFKSKEDKSTISVQDVINHLEEFLGLSVEKFNMENNGEIEYLKSITFKVE